VRTSSQQDVKSSEAPHGQWLSLDEVIDRIVADSGRATPAIAFAISGGGATGAYEAGVLEAWLQRVQKRYPTVAYLRPKFVLGSSAGALNAITVLVSNLRPSAGPAFGFEVWESITPRASRYVVGKTRSCLVDLATRWVKLPRLALFAATLGLLFAALLIVSPVLGSLPLDRLGAHELAQAIQDHPVRSSAAGALVAVAVGLLVGIIFRDAVFGNAALKRTLACVLSASCDPKTGKLPKGALRRRPNPMQASEALVASWYEAVPRTRINFIVTATDLSTGGANLFTLVEPEVYKQLANYAWQVMQLSATKLPPSYGGSPNCGWVSARDFVTCVVASTSIPGVFPSQRLMLHSLDGKDDAEHDFVDGGVLNNTPIHIAIDAGATHVISLELEPLRRERAFMYVERGEPPNLARNVAETFQTLLASATRQGIRVSSSWNRQIRDARGAAPSGKRLVPIFRMAPRRRELNLIDFNGHYHSAFSKAHPSLEQWLIQGQSDAGQPKPKLFWDATFQADP